jgi:thioredoxin reductase
MEAAVALAKQSATRIDVVYRGSDHRRGKRRNIAEFRRLCDTGRVRVHWSAEVTAIGAETVALASDEKRTLRYDALFVMIGGESSGDLLPSAAR